MLALLSKGLLYALATERLRRCRRASSGRESASDSPVNLRDGPARASRWCLGHAVWLTGRVTQCPLGTGPRNTFWPKQDGAHGRDHHGLTDVRAATERGLSGFWGSLQRRSDPAFQRSAGHLHWG